MSFTIQIVARYFMGYWPAKLISLLNIVITVGYGIIACIIAGQILSAVSGGSMSIVVGIIVTALISWLVTVFGMAVFQTYQRQVFCLSEPTLYKPLDADNRQMGLDPTSGRPVDIGRHRS